MSIKLWPRVKNGQIRYILGITYPLADGSSKTARFTDSFIVGRQRSCAVQIEDTHVSREHLKIYPEAGQWWAEDLGSRNGSYIDGRTIHKIPLSGDTAIELGRGGAVVHLRLAGAIQSQTSRQPASAPSQLVPALRQSVSPDDITEHYFDSAYRGPMGKHTQMIRIAFQRITRKQSQRYWGVIALLFILLLGGGGGWWWWYDLQRELAINIFYSMKVLELQIANLEVRLETALAESPKTEQAADLAADIAAEKQQLADLTKQYDDFLAKINFVEKIKPLVMVQDDVEGIILRMARLFGECQLDVSDDFVDEVKRYIARWKATPRLENAIRRLKEKGYAPIIYRAMTAQQVPPQFLYLALQESNFQEQIVGPSTRYGYAKGMWQFIPETGLRYGLQPGPLKDLGVYDPQDDRHDPKKATIAAAKYIRDIYRTDAQASGLLVMASYNWGEGNIIRRIRQMPANPRERNFWQLLKQHDIPKETYGYVFYIFSAAVIGENPKLFGFGFDNPLQDLLPPATTAYSTTSHQAGDAGTR
ncbi:MAG TPA: transglycosylase SLT domain-containing protein [Candidatus Competibacter sp.]|nr:transglycosylase SLT domain-containing protein [Candidatus Competibacter sp.]